MLFDAHRLDGSYMSYVSLLSSAQQLGLEVVPQLALGIFNLDSLAPYLEVESFLGGKVEGVVVKRFRSWEHPAIPHGKLVRADFKETRARKSHSPSKGDLKEDLREVALQFSSPRRWEKAVERLRDEGRLEGGPEDIGPLMGVVARDLVVECEEGMIHAVWKMMRKPLMRAATQPIAEWYQKRLETNDESLDQ